MIISETGTNGVKRFLFKIPSPSEVLQEVGNYQGDKGISSKKRAVAILQCYGGFENYIGALASNNYTAPLIEDQTGGSSVSGINRNLHPGDFPLQIFPDGSPLNNLKKAITEIDENAVIPPIKFTNDCQLSQKKILEIQKNQERVVRFAVKSNCPAQWQELVRGGDDIFIQQQCFTNKESPGEQLKRAEYGLMSSYITPLKLYLHQSGAQAGKRVQENTEATIYYTGFGYPVFDEQYCQRIVLTEDKNQKKSELKAIFKQQIFAVLLARNQQIEHDEIKTDTKVPLVLNRPFDFMRAQSPESAQRLREFVNESLCELFQEPEVADAMRGKIDQVLIWDPESDIYAKDEKGQKIGESLGTTKFFDNLGSFREIFQGRQYKLEEQGSFIEVFDATGADMISIARCYEEHKKIKLAIPGMVNPTHQDGEGAMIGIGATEESLNVASLGMMQIYLNSLHNQRLKSLEILDSGTLQRFTATIKEVEAGNVGAAQGPSSSTPKPQPMQQIDQVNPILHETSLETGVYQIVQETEVGKTGLGAPDQAKSEDIKKEVPDNVFSNSDQVNPAPQPSLQNILILGGASIGAGLAGAGAVVLCASALGLGIVSAPVVAVAVVVGVACAGATAVTLNEQLKLKESNEGLRVS